VLTKVYWIFSGVRGTETQGVKWSKTAILLLYLMAIKPGHKTKYTADALILCVAELLV